MGRPRSTECDGAILDAALSEYAARGLDGMSVDAVAARAGVSKATIYRRYPSKIELVIAAASLACEESAPIPDTGSLHNDLVAGLRNLRKLLEDPVLGAAKRRLVIDAAHDPQLARAHRELVRRRRARMFDVLRRAIDRGELQPDLDLDFAADQIGAPMFYRYLLMHERVTNAYIDQVVDAFLARYGAMASSL
jgi:AcrR family transcriptional regulator